MAFVPRNRAKSINARLRANAKLPESGRRSREQIEAEVDALIADDIKNGEAREIEKKARMVARKVGHYFEFRARLRQELFECKSIDEAVLVCEEFGTVWGQESTHLGEAERLFEMSKLMRFALQDFNDDLYLCQDLVDEGIISGKENSTRAEELVLGRLIERLAEDGLEFWAQAMKSNDFTTIMEHIPEKTSVDIEKRFSGRH